MEKSEIKYIDTVENPEAHREHIAKLLKETEGLDPSSVLCMMQIVVVKGAEDSDKHDVTIGIAGSDSEIARMFASLAKVVRNGVITAHSPTNPNNETSH